MRRPVGPVLALIVALAVAGSAFAQSAGERAYAKCLACHALGPGRDDRDGPTLYRLIGRRVASIPGQAYSPAMRAYARRLPRWTNRALDAFLADPQAVVPGNTMGFFGMPDPVERAALVAWLAAPRR